MKKQQTYRLLTVVTAHRQFILLMTTGITITNTITTGIEIIECLIPKAREYKGLAFSREILFKIFYFIITSMSKPNF